MNSQIENLEHIVYFDPTAGLGPSVPAHYHVDGTHRVKKMDVEEMLLMLAELGEQEVDNFDE